MNLNLLIGICIICWGFWGILDKKALETGSNRDVVLMLYSLYLPQIPVVLVLCNLLDPGWKLTSEIMFWTGLAAFNYTLASVAYLTALSRTDASYVLGITAGYPLILQFVATIFLGEALVPNRLVGALLIGLGVCAISWARSEEHKQMHSKDQLILIVCIVIATLCWGVWGIFDKKALGLTTPLVVYFAQSLWDIVMIAMLWLIFRAQGYKPNFRQPAAWKFCALSSVCLAIGAWSYLSAMSISTASYVIVITGCYPLLMYLFALLFLKEKFSRVRLGGIALVVLGGVLVQLTQKL